MEIDSVQWSFCPSGSETENMLAMEEYSGKEQVKTELESTVDHSCQLYVKFPCVLPPIEEIKALHPYILHVFARKRKKPKFCYLAFSSPEAAQKAMEELSSVPYKDLGHLDVRPMDDRRILPRSIGARGDRKRWLIVYGIPPTEPDIDVLHAFHQFGCTHAHVHHQDTNEVLRKGSARLLFDTVEDSVTFLANTNVHYYKGAPLEVKFLKTGPSKSACKRLVKKERRSRLLEQTGCSLESASVPGVLQT